MAEQLVLLYFLVQPVMGIDDGKGGGTPPALNQAQPQALSMEQVRDLLDNWPAHLKDLAAQYQAAQQPPTKANGNRAQRRAQARKS